MLLGVGDRPEPHLVSCVVRHNRADTVLNSFIATADRLIATRLVRSIIRFARTSGAILARQPSPRAASVKEQRDGLRVRPKVQRGVILEVLVVLHDDFVLERHAGLCLILVAALETSSLVDLSGNAL